MKKVALTAAAALTAWLVVRLALPRLPSAVEEITINDRHRIRHEYYAPRKQMGLVAMPDPRPGEDRIYLIKAGRDDHDLIKPAVWHEIQRQPERCRLLTADNIECLQTSISVYWRSSKTSNQWLRWNIDSGPKLYSFIKGYCGSTPQFTEETEGRYKRLRGPSDIFVSDSPDGGCWLPYNVDSVNLKKGVIRMKLSHSITELPPHLVFALGPDDLFGEQWEFDLEKTKEECRR